MNTPENITSLKPNEIFVFGSNLAGRHGKGAAKTALQWGAKYGVGEGLQGQTYAIPTKDDRLKPLSLSAILDHINTFLNFTVQNPDLTFLVTKIGCGYAGDSPSDIGAFFIMAPENVILPYEFEFINPSYLIQVI